MKKQLIKKNLFDLQENTGQIAGVPANPREIKKSEFKKLIESILLFPEMLELRPITEFENVILGGNQRLKGLTLIATLTHKQIVKKLENVESFRNKEPQFQEMIFEFWRSFINDEEKKVPVQEILEISSPEQLREFIIKDNVEYGENDYEMLLESWDATNLKDWGLSLPKNWESPEEEPTDDKSENTKKSIQISFNADDYVEAYRHIQWFRDNKIYLGKGILKELQELKRANENSNN